MPLHKLLTELVQPTYSVNLLGKIMIDKAPAEGARRPNLAFAKIRRPPMRINPQVLADLGRPNRGVRVFL